MLDTKKIVLEQTTESEFQLLQRFWGTKIRIKCGTIYSKVKIPPEFTIEQDREESYMQQSVR